MLHSFSKIRKKSMARTTAPNSKVKLEIWGVSSGIMSMQDARYTRL